MMTITNSAAQQNTFTSLLKSLMNVAFLHLHFLWTLTVPVADGGQTAGIGGGAGHTGVHEQGRSFCVLEEAGVGLSFFQTGEAVY